MQAKHDLQSSQQQQRDTAVAATATAVTSSLIIPQPVERVWSLAVAPGNLTSLIPGCTSLSHVDASLHASLAAAYTTLSSSTVDIPSDSSSSSSKPGDPSTGWQRVHFTPTFTWCARVCAVDAAHKELTFVVAVPPASPASLPHITSVHTVRLWPVTVQNHTFAKWTTRLINATPQGRSHMARAVLSRVMADSPTQQHNRC